MCTASLGHDSWGLDSDVELGRNTYYSVHGKYTVDLGLGMGDLPAANIQGQRYEQSLRWPGRNVLIHSCFNNE